MKNTFLEERLVGTFDKEVQEVRKKLKNNNIVTVVGLPSIGISVFLKYLATHNKNEINIHFDLYDLHTISTGEFYTLFLKNLGVKSDTKNDVLRFDHCENALQELAKKHSKINLIFNRFDQLKSEYSANFFNSILKLSQINPQKINFIFSANRPYEDVFAEICLLDDHEKLLNYYYLKPFRYESCVDLLKLFPQSDVKDKDIIKKAYELSGGHYLLFQFIIRSQRLSDFLKDSYIRLLLKEIYEYFTYEEKKQLNDILSEKEFIPNKFLFEIGAIQDSGNLFSPLFEEYIRKNTSSNLGQNELKLFDLLKSNVDRIISKDEIIETLWNGDAPEVTDWALNSLVYRLRRNKAFINSDFIIQSIKKQGYVMRRK